MRESEVDEVRKAIESVRTETLLDPAPIDKPVMLPKPDAPRRRPTARRRRRRQSRRASAAAAEDQGARQERSEARSAPRRKHRGHEDIEATKAPLIEHLIELRRRLIWALLAVFLAFLVCFWFAGRSTISCSGPTGSRPAPTRRSS